MTLSTGPVMLTPMAPKRLGGLTPSEYRLAYQKYLKILRLSNRPQSVHL
jgi:hypothetical protein